MDSTLNLKVDIAPNLLKEAGTDPLSVFNKLMAAKDKDKALTNPGRLHFFWNLKLQNFVPKERLLKLILSLACS